MHFNALRALVVLFVALASTAVLAQPVLWSRTFGGALGSNGPTVEVVSDGAGGVYVARLSNPVDASVTRLDASGAVLWTVPVFPFPQGCVQCTYSLADLAADASGAYLKTQVSAIKVGPCGISCSTVSVVKLAAANGASSGVFSITSSPLLGGHTVEAFAVGPGGDVAIAGADNDVGSVRRLGTSAFTVNAGNAFENVVFGSGGQVVALLRTASTWSLRAYTAGGTLQWSRDLGERPCGVLIAGPGERVACTRALAIEVIEADGSLAWEAANPGEAVRVAKFDGLGNLWLAGGTCTVVELVNVCTPRVWKRSPSGALLASDAAPDRGGLGTWDALSIASNGDVYVASLMVTARYDSSGSRQWISAPRGSARESNNLVASDDGAIVGGIDRSTPGHDVTVLKLGAAALPAPIVQLTGPAVAPAGEPFALTVTVVGTPPPTGNVRLFDGASELCLAALASSGGDRSSAVCTVVLGAGNHALTARFEGSAVYAESSTSLALLAVGDSGAADVPVLPLPLLAALVAMLLLAASYRLRR